MNELFSTVERADARVAPMAGLHVEVIADLICPFCYLGKRRLDRSLEAMIGPREIGWYPYQLNPDMPKGGMSIDDYFVRRFGSPKTIQPVLDGLIAEGREEGIDFRFDRIERVPNTMPAHQVMHLAATQGIDQTALGEDLMKAFFEEGRDISETDVLVTVAAAHHLSADTVARATVDDKIRENVLGREAQVRSSGMSGVPGFLLNRRLLVVGAQSIETMINAFDHAMFGEGDDDLEAVSIN